MLEAGFDKDSLKIRKYTGNSKIEVYNNANQSDKDISRTPILNIVNSSRLTEAERNYFKWWSYS